MTPKSKILGTIFEAVIFAAHLAKGAFQLLLDRVSHPSSDRKKR